MSEEKLRKQARNRYKNLPAEEKLKKREYGKIRYISKNYHKTKIIYQIIHFLIRYQMNLILHHH